MKTNLKLFGSYLAICIAMIACDKSSLAPVSDQEISIEKFPKDSSSVKYSLELGETIIKPLKGSLTNLVSENFETGGRNYHCYQLKLEKLYPVHVVYPNGSEGYTDLSFSINFKFYSDQENSPVDEEFTIEYQNDLAIYYKAMNKGYAIDKKAIAFIYGDRSLDRKLNGNAYNEYLKSQVGIASGSLHIKKSGELYLVSFEGETETGEKVSCNYNDLLTALVDNQFESQEEDFSVTEIPGNYIQKGEKYYKLDDGFFYIFSRSTNQENTIQTVQVIAIRDYYRYEYNYNRDKEYSGLFDQHWKSNAVFLQFQFTDLNQFQPKKYQVASSEGIYSIGYGLGAFRNIAYVGFPDNSRVIGYYHISTDTPFTFTYDEDPNYMKNQIALKSGQLEITVHSSEYEFSGTFIDAQDEEVKIKFKATAYPWNFEQ